MNQDSIGYYQQRERIERSAAKTAASCEARRAHQQLAQSYAAILHGRASDSLLNEDDKLPAPLTVLDA
jgi:hypothetical protein